jgi:outer membrane protein TolC
LNAQKDLASAKQQAEVARLKLKTFIGYRDEASFDLLIPAQIRLFEVDEKSFVRGFGKSLGCYCF